MATLSFGSEDEPICEFAKTERVLAETQGAGLAMLFGGLGAITRQDVFWEPGENGGLI